MNKIAIVGMGIVGQGMLKIFPNAYQFDEPKGIGSREEVNACEMAVICVPTPMREDRSCDTSIVENVLGWIESPLILIKSAVEPGTTDKLKKKFNKRIVVSPEYMGESTYWIPERLLDPTNPLSHGFVILGGDDKDCEEIADLFTPVVGPVTRIRFVKAIEAEIIKYAENSFFATKVIFSNELRSICEVSGASWHRVREGWLDDPRISPMHTAVFKDKRGFGGKCYPKDLNALIALALKNGFDPIMLKAVWDSNVRFTS